MSFLESLRALPAVILHQRHEVAELIGFETRNKYSIDTEQGSNLGFAAEQQKGFLGFLVRQFLGHWRTFQILFFNAQRQPVMRAIHPFRLFFQRLEVRGPLGEHLGAVQQRFAILTRKFDVEGSSGEILMTVASPFWKIWTFPVMKHGREVARVEKKWSGLLSEAFTDKDRFRIQFLDPELSLTERQLLLAAGMFIDLQYFERKAR